MKHETPRYTTVTAAVLLLLLCACSSETGKPGTETASGQSTTPETAEAVVKYTLPVYEEYAGRTFTILAGEGYNTALVEGADGEPLNDAKWQMQRTVEEAYGITIAEETTDFWEMTKTVSQYIMSGETTYDAISMMDRFALTSAMEGAFQSMSNIQTVHLDSPWWGTDITDQLSVGGNIYFGITSAQLESFGKTSCILWNTTLGNALGLEVPWDDVFAGTWTFEDYASYRTVADSDLNGNGEWDPDDRYTYGAADVRGAASQFWQAADLKIVTKDADDIPHITAYDNEKLFNHLESVYNLMYSGANNLYALFPIGAEKACGDSFLEGNILLYSGLFSTINQAREMENDFAVLPMPKYDEAQESYRSRTYDATFHMIPTTQADPEYAGVILDALSCAAYYDLVPVYVETTLKEKASRDENSMKSIQMCFDTRTLDFGEAFMFDYFGDEAIYRNIMSKSQFNMASYLEKKSKAANKQLEKVVDALINE